MSRQVSHFADESFVPHDTGEAKVPASMNIHGRSVVTEAYHCPYFNVVPIFNVIALAQYN